MFTYEIRNHKKDGHEFAEISGYEGSVSELVVPGEIDGYKVEAIGNHAFSGRQDLVSVTLPESIKTLYGFAFHNCRKLKKITLFDSLDDYYDGVCRQCDSLQDIEITINAGWYEVVRNFLADNDRTLRFTLNINGEDGYNRAVLTFPEYVYDFNENTMARTIQFSIAGSGMFYRECVDRKSIDYRAYDRLFDKAVIDGGSISEDIAIGRLLYPVELEDSYKKSYELFVKKNSFSIMERLVKTAQSEHGNQELAIALLTYENKDPDRQQLINDECMDEAIKLSSQMGLTTFSAALIDARKKTSESGAGVFEF